MKDARSKEITKKILGIVGFNFVGYLTIGLPLAVLPPYVKSLGFGPVLAGITISIQYIATFLSRAPVGRMSDTQGPKKAVLIGLFACGASGIFLVGAEALRGSPAASLACLFIGRLVLGCGESFVTTGAILWGIGTVGASHTARVISWNGVTTYAALALGAPLGTWMEQKFGFYSLGITIVVIAWVCIPLALPKANSEVIQGKRIPLHKVFGRIVPYGMSLALASVGFGMIATFITLFYLSRRWPDAAYALTAFGLFFVSVRLIFGWVIDRFGGYAVALVSFVVEVMGLLLLWKCASPAGALVGATLTGIGFSLVFPALAVEAVNRVSHDNRGAALAMYSVFVDVALGITGPVGGWIASGAGYSSIFLFAAVTTTGALAIVGTLFVRGSARWSLPATEELS